MLRRPVQWRATGEPRGPGRAMQHPLEETGGERSAIHSREVNGGTGGCDAAPPSSIGSADAIDEGDEEAFRPQAGAHLGRAGRQVPRGLADHGLDEPAGLVKVGDVEEDGAEDDPDPDREAVETGGSAPRAENDLLVV